MLSKAKMAGIIIGLAAVAFYGITHVDALRGMFGISPEGVLPKSPTQKPLK